jgi:hypothetical protein
MKSLFKKQPPASIPWHPDFRDATTLPDVKVVRTRFFINGFSVLLFAGVALTFGHQEVERRTLVSESAMLQDQIRQNRARHDEALRLQREFQGNERFINELDLYLGGSLDLSKFLVSLAVSIPLEMTLTAVRYQDVSERGQSVGKQIVLNGSIAGSPDAAATVITEYLKVFRDDPSFADTVEDAVPISLIPTLSGDLMSFGIQLTLTTKKPAEPEPASTPRGGTSR